MNEFREGVNELREGVNEKERKDEVYSLLVSLAFEDLCCLLCESPIGNRLKMEEKQVLVSFANEVDLKPAPLR